jgi:putrescine transport system ATP-binding protein
VRPEAIRIVAADAPGAVAGVVRAAAFLGAGSELVVETAMGTLVVSADGDAAIRHAAGSPVAVSWPAEEVVRVGDTE